MLPGISLGTISQWSTCFTSAAFGESYDLLCTGHFAEQRDFSGLNGISDSSRNLSSLDLKFKAIIMSFEVRFLHSVFSVALKSFPQTIASFKNKNPKVLQSYEEKEKRTCLCPNVTDSLQIRNSRWHNQLGQWHFARKNRAHSVLWGPELQNEQQGTALIVPDKLAFYQIIKRDVVPQVPLQFICSKKDQKILPGSQGAPLWALWLPLGSPRSHNGHDGEAWVAPQSEVRRNQNGWTEAIQVVEGIARGC